MPYTPQFYDENQELDIDTQISDLTVDITNMEQLLVTMQNLEDVPQSNITELEDLLTAKSEELDLLIAERDGT